MKKRQYSDNDKATFLAALDANGGNLSKTCRLLKIPRQTLQDWAAGRKISSDVPEMRQVKKEELAEKLEELAHALVEGIHRRVKDGVLDPQVSLRDAATSLGIVIDKMQLLKGQPTPAANRPEEQGRARAEAAISQFIDEAWKVGEEVSREEAIRYLKPRLPEITEWLN